MNKSNLSRIGNLDYEAYSPEEQKAKGVLGKLRGVCADFINPTRNGRTYSEELWENVFKDPILQEKIENKCCFGELGHPLDRTEIDMEKAAICLSAMPKKNKDGKLEAEFDIIDTPNGRILKTFCDYGTRIGISSRGEGDLVPGYNGDSVDPTTYSCETWDCVLIPAVKDARLDYIPMTESLNNKKTLRQALKESFDNSSEDDKKVMRNTFKDLDIDVDDQNSEFEQDHDDKQILTELNKKVCKSCGYTATDFENGACPNCGEKYEDILTEGRNYRINIYLRNTITGDTAVRCHTTAGAFGTMLSRRDPNLELVYEKSIDGISAGELILAKTPTDTEIDNYDKTGPKVFLYVDGAVVKKTNYKPSVIKLLRDKYNKYIVIAPLGKLTAAELESLKQINSSTILESSNKNVFDITDESLNINEDTNYYEYIMSLLDKLSDDQITDFANKYHCRVSTYKEFDDALKELFDRGANVYNIYNDLSNYCDSIGVLDESLNINEAQSTAVGNNEAIVEELQKALSLNAELTKLNTELHEKLSVCHAKEVASVEKVEEYKSTIQRLTEEAKQDKASKAKNEALVTELDQKNKDLNAKVDVLNKRLSEAKGKLVKNSDNNISLQESLTKNNETNLKLTAQIKQLNESLNKAKSEKSEVEKNLIKADAKAKSLEESLNSKTSEFEKTISAQNEKLTKSSKLVEKYKRVAKVALDKYIESEAEKLGSTITEIKNRLPESYTFDDIDKVCEDLRSYNVSMSRLPYRSINENMKKDKVKMTSSSPTSSALNGFDDDIDDSLMSYLN